MNRNPFIDYPTLADYVFGANFGQPWFAPLSTNTFDTSKVVLYPNPADGKVNLSNPRQIDLKNVTIYDLTGRIVLTGNSSGMNGNEIQIDGSILPSGHYLLGLYGTQGRRQARICVVNP